MFPPDLIQTSTTDTIHMDVEQFNGVAVSKFALLSEECATQNLQEIGLKNDDIHTILSYTPLYSSPPFSTKCLPLKSLRQNVLHTPFHALASAGGVALLSYAQQYLIAHPTHCALTMTAECGSRLWSRHAGPFSTHLRRLISEDVKANKEQIYQQIVVASLLGDAVSSCLLLGDHHPLLQAPAKDGQRKRKIFPRIMDTYSCFVPETEDCLGSHFSSSGPRVYMSRELASRAPSAMIEAVSILLERNQLSKSDIKLWLLHPGGPKILELVQETLGMTAHDFRYSWAALAEVGNVSSASVLHAYEICLKENPDIPPSAWGIMVAVGPGIRVEAALLQWR